jgi:hypothetical protein
MRSRRRSGTHAHAVALIRRYGGANLVGVRSVWRNDNIHRREFGFEHRRAALLSTAVELTDMVPVGPGPQRPLDHIQISAHCVPIRQRLIKYPAYERVRAPLNCV